MIDWERVSDLRSEIGDQGFSEVVALFLEEADEVVQRLGSATDGTQILGDLHFLKGSALNLGFADLAALCQRVERGSGPVTAEIGGIVATYRAARRAFLDGLGQRAA